MTEHIVYIDDIEDLVLAKYFIEKKLIENGVIKEKTSLPEFIHNFIKLNNTIAIYDISTIPQVVPFYIYKLENDIYIFFSEKTEYSELTYKKLKSLNYNLTGLSAYTGGNTLLRINNLTYNF